MNKASQTAAIPLRRAVCGVICELQKHDMLPPSACPLQDRPLRHSGSAVWSLRFFRSLSHCRSTQVFTNRKLHSVDLCDKPAGRQTVVYGVRFRLAKQGKLLLKLLNALERCRQLCVTSDHSLVSTISTIPGRLPSRFVCQNSTVACSPPNAAGRRSQNTPRPARTLGAFGNLGRLAPWPEIPYDPWVGDHTQSCRETPKCQRAKRIVSSANYLLHSRSLKILAPRLTDSIHL